MLSEQQKRVVAAALAGHNIALVGGPGTGKSHTLKAILVALQSFPDRRVEVTGATGQASVLVGGITAHSLFCMHGLPEGHLAKTAQEGWALMDEQFRRRATTMGGQRLRSADVIVLDEVSMISTATMHAFDRAVTNICGGEGGLKSKQVIFVGDFAQLPPVVQNDDLAWAMEHSALSARWRTKYPRPDASFREQSGCFAFQSEVWESLKLKVFLLEHNFRQQGDAREWLSLMNSVRMGSVTDEELALLNSRVLPPDTDLALRLFTRRKDVEIYNSSALRRVQGTPVKSEAGTFYSAPAPSGQPGSFVKVPESEVPEPVQRLTRPIARMFKEHCQARPQLTLKVGATVMVVANLSEQVVNGTQGRVEAISQDDKGKIVGVTLRTADQQTHEVKPHVWRVRVTNRPLNLHWSYIQLPLAIAYATTVHKVQGATLERVVATPSSSMPGLATVMVSRCPRDGLLLTHPVQRSHIVAHPDAVHYYRMLERGSTPPPTKRACAPATATFDF